MLTAEQKQKMKKKRLLQYDIQIHDLEIDIVAHEAVGDTMKADEARKAIEDYKKAYAAVEGME